MRFGIEEEFFVFSADGRVPSHEQCESLYDALSDLGHHDRELDSNGSTLCVSRIARSGKLAIKNDFCTNVLEIAFPACTSPDEFRTEWERAFADLDDVLPSISLRRVHQAVLPQTPSKVVLRASPSDPDGRRARSFQYRVGSCESEFATLTPADICATQVSFDRRDGGYFSHLRKLYRLEYLVPLMFSSRGMFQGQARFFMRHAIYRSANWTPNTSLCGIPSPIPSTQHDYQELIDQGYRDYSYIVPKGSRLEFRSCDALGDCDAVLEMVLLRMLIWRAATQDAWPFSEVDSRELLDRLHLEGPAAFAETFQHDLALLERLPLPGWEPTMERLTKRLQVMQSGG